jgi:hypothetical protein
MINEHLFVIRVASLGHGRWLATAATIRDPNGRLDADPQSEAQGPTPWDAAKDALAAILPDEDEDRISSASSAEQTPQSPFRPQT